MTTRNDDTPQGYCPFEVGQHVVCVDDAVGSYRIPGVRYAADLTGLKAQRVYTVRDVFISPLSGTVCIRLLEITRPSLTRYRGVEAGYDARRFRPLPKLKIEDFMTADAPAPADARESAHA